MLPPPLDYLNTANLPSTDIFVPPDRVKPAARSTACTAAGSTVLTWLFPDLIRKRISSAYQPTEHRAAVRTALWPIAIMSIIHRKHALTDRLHHR